MADFRGQLIAEDEPDVCVLMDGHRTGVEFTELHQRPEAGVGPRRVQESERSVVVRRARALAEASAMPVVDVAVHFNDSIPIKKSDRDAIANRLVDLVSLNMPATNGSIVVDLWRQVGNPLPWIRTVRLYRAEILTKHTLLGRAST